MKFVIVTNNPRVRDELGKEFEVDFADITYREVLCKVRDMIYEGHKLLTHPLSGSVKPVSYTHLDVYKRQRHVRVRAKQKFLVELFTKSSRIPKAEPLGARRSGRNQLEAGHCFRA